MSTSKYWSTSKAEIKRLKKRRKELNKEIQMLRERDMLKAEIARQSREKFYRSRAGKAYLTGKRIGGGIKKIATSPETKKRMSKLERDIEALGKKVWRRI